MNYAHAAKFVTAAESFMAAWERQGFRQSPYLLDFKRRWKTQVYFSLRQKEALQRLAAAAGKEGASAILADRQVTSAGAYWLESSVELMRVLETMWSESWYLE